MTATYTVDVFSSLDGFGAVCGDWTGYWGKQGPELLERRLELYEPGQRTVFGANTYRAFARMLAAETDPEVRDPWVTQMLSLPATVVSTTLEEPFDWPNATVALFPRSRAGLGPVPAAGPAVQAPNRSMSRA